MSEFDIADKTFKVTPALKKWADECGQAIDYLIYNAGDEAHHIRPIKIKLNDGKGGKFEEQCGMSFGEKEAGGKELNFIVSTHTNELTALRLVKLIKENYLKHEDMLHGNQINLIFGGDPERAKELLARLKDPNVIEMTEDEFEPYRNTRHKVNCNRVDIAQVPCPPVSDEKEWNQWNKAFEKFRYDSQPDENSSESERKWHKRLKDYYDSLESEHGTQGWLQQKHLALQKFKNRIDFHTTSRSGDPLAVKYKMYGQQLDGRTLRFFAHLGTVNIDNSPDEGSYLHMCSSINAKESDGMVFECGAHRDIDKSGKAAENAFYGAVLETFGIDMNPEVKKPAAVTMTSCENSKFVFPLLSPTSAHMKEGALNLVPDFYLNGKKILSNDTRIRNGKWGGRDEKESRFHAISSDDPLPEAIRNIVKNEHIPTHNNGDKIHKGQPAFWTTYTLSDGAVIPVIFRSPFDALTFMTPAKGWDDIDGRYSFMDMSTENKKITVHLKSKDKPSSTSEQLQWVSRTAKDNSAAANISRM